MPLHATTVWPIVRGAVPAVGEVPGRNGDQAVHEHERGDQHPDAEVIDPERALQLGNHPAHEVLVDLIDEDDKPQHPIGHAPTRTGAARSWSPGAVVAIGSSTVSATAGVLQGGGRRDERR